MDQLNHPIAVVAIMAAIAVTMREIAWFIKTTKTKKTNGHVDKNLEKISETLNKMNTNLLLLNNAAERQENHHEKVMDKLDRMRMGKHE